MFILELCFVTYELKYNFTQNIIVQLMD